MLAPGSQKCWEGSPGVTELYHTDTRRSGFHSTYQQLCPVCGSCLSCVAGSSSGRLEIQGITYCWILLALLGNSPSSPTSETQMRLPNLGFPLHCLGFPVDPEGGSCLQGWQQRAADVLSICRAPAPGTAGKRKSSGSCLVSGKGAAASCPAFSLLFSAGDLRKKKRHFCLHNL